MLRTFRALLDPNIIYPLGRGFYLHHTSRWLNSNSFNNRSLLELVLVITRNGAHFSHLGSSVTSVFQLLSSCLREPTEAGWLKRFEKPKQNIQERQRCYFFVSLAWWISGDSFKSFFAFFFNSVLLKSLIDSPGAGVWWRHPIAIPHECQSENPLIGTHL